MIITKKALPRRTFLRGASVSLALPLLDAMVPALTPTVKTAAAPFPRLGFIYTPNGYMRKYWVPTGTGKDWELTPSLQALEPFRDDVVLVTGLAQHEADARGEPPGPHSRLSGAWLTGVHVKQTEGADVRAGQSADQIAAARLGADTVLPSLELAIEQNEKLIGNCESGYTCVYQNTVSWRDATTPMPMETHPRVVFERLFGTGATPAEERRELGINRSILDFVTERLAAFTRQLGAGDRQRVNQYVESVRDIEARISRAEKRTSDLALSLPERPVDIPSEFEEHLRIMFDLQVLAYQGDITRVQTFLMSREQSARAYTQLGISTAHHAVSHHGGDPEKIAQKAKIDGFHVKLLTYYIDKLKQTKDGDGTLLDHVVVMYGAGIGDPNTHEPYDLPSIVFGRANGKLQTGRHLAFKIDDNVPQMNLLVSLLDLAGVPIDKLGDSTGRLAGLSGF